MTMAHEHRGLAEWVFFNETMCKMVGRVGAPKAIEIATVWLETMGRFYEEHAEQYDGGDHDRG